MKLLCFYVTKEHAESLKDVLFAMGAGRIGDYSHCCWQTVGQGQFKPLAGSDPHIGEQDTITYIEECKIEMVIEDDLLPEAIQALKQHHPYETPAYHVMSIET